MKIALDIGVLGQDFDTGVQRAAIGWCESLVDRYQEHEFVLTGVMARGFRTKISAYRWVKQANVIQKILYLPSRIVAAASLWGQRVPLRIEWLTGAVDVYHSFDGIHLASKAVSTTVIHDLSVFLYPQWHTKENVRRQEERMKVIRNRVGHIFCNSKFTQNQLIKFEKAVRKSTSILYLVKQQRAWVAEKKVQEQITQLRIRGKFWLYVGRLEPRKNIARLVDAHQKLVIKSNETPLLVVAGDEGWDKEAQRAVNRAEKVMFIGRVTDEELTALYQSAEALLYPSIYEGFGLPVLEAMGVGCLVVTSKGSSMEEVIGETGILVDPLSVGSLEKGLEEAMKMGGGEKCRLINAAKERSKMFEGKVAAEKMMSVWQKLLE